VLGRVYIAVTWQHVDQIRYIHILHITERSRRKRTGILETQKMRILTTCINETGKRRREREGNKENKTGSSCNPFS
jgi:hypothetical protein